jgi:hypothetical protein
LDKDKRFSLIFVERLSSSTSLYPTQKARKEELEGGEERRKKAKTEDR